MDALGEAVGVAVGRGGGVVMVGTLGVVEVGDGAGGTAEVLAALKRGWEGGGKGAGTWAAVGGALCACLERLGGAQGCFDVRVGAPGAGVALLLGAARRLPGMHTAGTASLEGLRGLSKSL